MYHGPLFTEASVIFPSTAMHKHHVLEINLGTRAYKKVHMVVDQKSIVEEVSHFSL